MVHKPEGISELESRYCTYFNHKIVSLGSGQIAMLIERTEREAGSRWPIVPHYEMFGDVAG